MDRCIQVSGSFGELGVVGGVMMSVRVVVHMLCLLIGINVRMS